MENLNFDKEITELLLIDPYNDFISEGGKVWDRLKAVAEANKCVPNMLQVLNAAPKAGLRVFYALHHRYRPGDYETWKYIAPTQKAAWSHKTFENGTWGGEIRREFEPQTGDIMALEHWCSSGLVNTDLDLQLKNHGIHLGGQEMRSQLPRALNTPKPQATLPIGPRQTNLFFFPRETSSHP
jgi:ureidoacrylate peracid hydrolase